MVVAAAALAIGLIQFPSFAQTSAQPPAQTPPPALPAPGTEAFGEEVMLTAKTIAFITRNSTGDTDFETLIDRFKSVYGFLDKQSLKPAGPAMAIYTAVSATSFQFQVAVPVAEVPANLPRGGITVGQSPAGKALKFVHRGSYDLMEMLYEAIRNFLDEKRIERQGLFIEEYITDPLTTPEDKLVVNVFVMVN